MSSSLRKFIKDGWGKARTTASETDLPLPFPFVPPSISSDGMHRTLYYWDTYFTNVGLIADGHTDWAKDNVENLLFALRYFGCVPNYTRKDGADFCSQPPLLFLMVRDIYRETQDEVWLAQAVEALEMEYAFWMKERMTPIGLNQYGCNATDPKTLLGYYEYVSTRIELPQELPETEKIRIARNFIAEGESGEDYTPRYACHNALDYAQIDLNSHLYGLEEFLADYYKGRDAQKSAEYAQRKQRRLTLIQRYCFNEKTGAYCDYDFVSGRKSDIVCCACFLPYYYGFASAEGDLSRVYAMLITKGGLAACQDTGDNFYQWGYPYIWAPYQYFAYKALVRYGLHEKAEELRSSYIRLLTSVYEKTGTLWERYDENGEAKDLEYPTQQMLGWTAGVYTYLCLQAK